MSRCAIRWSWARARARVASAMIRVMARKYSGSPAQIEGMDLLARRAGLAGEPARDDLAQADPVHVWHDHEMIAVGRADLVRLQEGRSRESEAAFGLSTELGQAVRLIRQGRFQDLDRHEIQEMAAFERLPYDPLRPAPAASAAGRSRVETRRRAVSWTPMASDARSSDGPRAPAAIDRGFRRRPNLPGAPTCSNRSRTS